MAFRFSLAAVLLLRRERERTAERALATAQRELNLAQAQLGAVRSELSRLAEQRAAEGAALLQGVALHEQYARWGLLDQARLELQQQVAHLETRRSAQRLAHGAARRDRELLEEMESKQRAQFLSSAAVQEQKRADELFLMRRFRQH